MITQQPPDDPWGSGQTRQPSPGLRKRPPRTILHWSVLDQNQVLFGIVGLLGIAVLALGILAMLPANDGCRDHSCAIGEPIGITWVEADDTLAVQYLPCGTERIGEVRIEELRTGMTLWHLSGDEPSDRTTFIAGQPPEPLVEVVSFERLPVGPLELTMVGNETYVLQFERSDLFGDFVFINGSRVVRDEFAEEAKKVGGCPERGAPVEADRSLMLSAGVIVLAGAAAALLAVRYIDIGSGHES